MSARYNDSERTQRGWLTEAEVLVLIAKELKPYHEENKEKFDELFGAMNQLKGSIQTAIWVIGSVISVVGLIIAFYKR